MHKPTERERECVKVKTLTYSPSTDSYYNKICISCIASFNERGLRENIRLLS